MRKPLIHTHCHLICCVYIKGCVSIHIVWCWRCWDRLIQEIKAMSKVSKIDQIHLKDVMLCMSKMSKMSKIDQIHLRAVMLCMSKMLKMGKEHTHTFWLITSLILTDFQSKKSFGKLRLRAFQPYHQILCILKHVEDVEDNLRHLRHVSKYIGFDDMVGKLWVSAFQNFFLDWKSIKY